MTDIRDRTDTPSLMLPAVLDLTQAAVLKQALQGAIAGGVGLSIDARGVTRATSPCLQVLLAGHYAFREQGGPPLSFSGVSDAFRETAITLGLADQFGLQEVPVG